jgi:hypothetical protein
MKFRIEREEPDENEIRGMEQWLHTTVRSQQKPVPGDPYWGRLLVQTNEQIDRETSPRALSISWLARVAIPGAVAVFSFVVALHYYAPGHRPAENGLETAMATLSEAEVDSLLVHEVSSGETAPSSLVGNEVFSVQREQVVEYLAENGTETQLMETLGDEQANAVVDRMSL